MEAPALGRDFSSNKYRLEKASKKGERELGGPKKSWVAFDIMERAWDSANLGWNPD